MRFALAVEPIDYQLTVHYNNYDPAMKTCQHFSRDFVSDFNYMSTFMDNEFVQKECPAMFNLISHYGADKIQLWLDTFIVRKTA